MRKRSTMSYYGSSRREPRYITIIPGHMASPEKPTEFEDIDNERFISRFTMDQMSMMDPKRW